MSESVLRFESLVNTEGSKTVFVRKHKGKRFESLVNTEGSKTINRMDDNSDSV